MKAIVVVVGLLLAATPAGAMTGQEFLQAYDRSVSDVAPVLKPLVRQFVNDHGNGTPDFHRKWTPC